MQALFYHDRRGESGARFLSSTAAFALGTLCAACGHAAQAPEPAGAPTTAPSVNARSAETEVTTPTAAAIAGGRDVIERLRAAGGGAALTALRSFDVTGTSLMSSLTAARQLKVRALFPQYYRQEEGPRPGVKGPAFHTTMGLTGDHGWLTGAQLGGDGRSPDRSLAERAYTRAARQAMAGFLAGVNAPWLIDTGRYTATSGGTVEAGVDRGALIVLLDGPDGRVGRLLIDPGTHLPRRLIEPPQPGGGGTAGIADIVFTYSDFQPQNGLQLPRTIVRETGPNRTVWSITKYTLNPRLTSRQFLPSRR